MFCKLCLIYKYDKSAKMLLKYILVLILQKIDILKIMVLKKFDLSM